MSIFAKGINKCCHHPVMMAFKEGDFCFNVKIYNFYSMPTIHLQKQNNNKNIKLTGINTYCEF